MCARRIVDVHAHMLSEDMMKRLRKEAPDLAFEIADVDAHGATLKVGSLVQTPYARGGWDLDKRLADMEASGIDTQVVSPVPQTFLYDLEPRRTEALCDIQNEMLGELARRMPDKFMGIGTLPMQSPELAAGVLERGMRQHGLKGAMICSHIEGRNLDDPKLDAVWAKAEALGAFILVHPQKVAAADRLGSYYLRNLIGNPLETTIAGASLIFGGVLERFPGIKLCLSHGGGFLPYQTGRFMHGWAVRPEPKERLPVPPGMSIARLYHDTILHSAPHLEFLISQSGANHILLGTDYPFDMGQMDAVRHVRALAIGEAQQHAILAGNPARLLDTA
jgi:aminocarboxymuconate-semialdehyde decarboxylase